MSTTTGKKGLLYAPTPRLPPTSLTLNTTYLHHDRQFSPSPSPSPITGSSCSSATVNYRQYNSPSPAGLYSSNGSRLSPSPSPINAYAPQYTCSYNPSPAISRSHTPIPPISTTINEFSTHTTDAVRRYGGLDDLSSSTSFKSTSLFSEKKSSSPSSIVSMATRILTRIVPPFRSPTSSRNAPRLRIDKSHIRKYGHRRQYSISSRGSLYGYGVPDAAIMLIFIIACLFFIAALCGFGADDETLGENAVYTGGEMNKATKEERRSNSYLYAYMHVDPDGYVSHHLPNAYASVNTKEQQQMFFATAVDNGDTASGATDNVSEQVDEEQLHLTATDFSFTSSVSDSNIPEGEDVENSVPLAAGEDTFPDPTPAPLPPSRADKFTFYGKLQRNAHRRLVIGNTNVEDVA